MSENKVIICPCCDKACDLKTPGCSRGEEYLRTGVIPEKGRRGRHHEEHQYPNYEEMGTEEKLFVLLGKLGRMGHGAFDGKSSQHRILHILSKSERMTQRELTEQLGIRPGSASEIIKKLESAGLITRQSNSEDRRTVDIALTDAGKAQAEATNAQHANHALFEILNEEEKQQLLGLLEKLGQDWHNRFRGEIRSEHKHHSKGDHDHKHGHGRKHGQDHEHRRGDKHGHDSERGRGHKQSREHHNDSF